MLISEVFGYGVDDQSEEARTVREGKHCPFRNSPCTKSSKTDPLGICSLSDGIEAASLCPVRFVERDQIFMDAARIAFGDGVSFGIFPEIRILKIEVTEGERERKIGKVDYVLGRIDNGQITDFAAVEVQAAYFSGNEIRTVFKAFLQEGRSAIEGADRRPDFRSSAQKRLVPQLQLKVPVFRRWGKKFFVVVDTQFFRALPGFASTTAGNSEVTWLSYPIRKAGENYRMEPVDVIYSEWDEVQNALREGAPPDPLEIIQELQTKLEWPEARRPKILTV